MGKIKTICRHPVKGFTPESLDQVYLQLGSWFPDDRLYVVENGPSGFDPAAPRHIRKTHFTVLAWQPSIAKLKTQFQDGLFSLTAPSNETVSFDLKTENGQIDFAAWLEGWCRAQGIEVKSAFRVLHAQNHRFMDDPTGAVSIINLASVRDLTTKLGQVIDPLRFRGNFYYEGEAWQEDTYSPGRRLKCGAATLEVVKPIIRCRATHVDPESGHEDIDLVRQMYTHFERNTCGLYCKIVESGVVCLEDDLAEE